MRRPAWARPTRRRCPRWSAAAAARPTIRLRLPCCGSRRCARSRATPDSRWPRPPARSHRTGPWTCARATRATPRARARRGGCPRCSSPRRKASRCSCRAPTGASASRTSRRWSSTSGTSSCRRSAACRWSSPVPGWPACGPAFASGACRPRSPISRTRPPRWWVPTAPPRPASSGDSRRSGSTSPRSPRRRSSASRGPGTSACACCRRSCARSSRRVRHWSSPTCGRARRSGTRRCSRRGRTGPGRSRSTTARSDARCASGSSRRLREGRLRAVVCTSSLDLGVDFAPVDQVLQIGSPKGVGRLLQRAGRSGHRPGEVSRVTVLPTHALELVEAAAARDAAAAGDGGIARAGRRAARRPRPAPRHVRARRRLRPRRARGGSARHAGVRAPRRRRLALRARLRRARRREPQCVSRVPPRGDRRGRHRPGTRRRHRASPSHVDRDHRRRGEHHRATCRRQGARPRRGVVRRAPRAGKLLRVRRARAGVRPRARDDRLGEARAGALPPSCRAGWVRRWRSPRSSPSARAG